MGGRHPFPMRLILLVVLTASELQESFSLPQNLVEKVEIPAMARKAGGGRRSWQSTIPQSESVAPPENEGWEDSDYESEEEDCPHGEFFHIRGKQCVPLNCHGARRDRQSGQCEQILRYGSLYSTGRYGNGHSRMNPTVFRTIKYPKPYYQRVRGYRMLGG